MRRCRGIRGVCFRAQKAMRQTIPLCLGAVMELYRDDWIALYVNSARRVEAEQRDGDGVEIITLGLMALYFEVESSPLLTQS